MKDEMKKIKFYELERKFDCNERETSLVLKIIRIRILPLLSSILRPLSFLSPLLFTGEDESFPLNSQTIAL